MKKKTDWIQLKKYASDFHEIYLSGEKKKKELEIANMQLKKYAEALNKTINELKEANKKLYDQVETEIREKLIQCKLLQANKMTALGTLASGLAHEINNPINFILSNSQILQAIWLDVEKVIQKYYLHRGNFYLGGLPYLEIKEEVPHILSGNIEGTIRIINIIKGLREFSREEDMPLKGKININEIINFAIMILKGQINKCTESFNLKLEEHIPETTGNSQQIEQVLINIIQNALQSLPDKKSEIYLSSFYDKSSTSIKVRIKDEGIGMSEEILHRIREPFFTTKKAGEGTGLGLYISFSIIKNHKGSLDIFSKPGKGTDVIISLPVK